MVHTLMICIKVCMINVKIVLLADHTSRSQDVFLNLLSSKQCKLCPPSLSSFAQLRPEQRGKWNILLQVTSLCVSQLLDLPGVLEPRLVVSHFLFFFFFS